MEGETPTEKIPGQNRTSGAYFVLIALHCGNLGRHLQEGLRAVSRAPVAFPYSVTSWQTCFQESLGPIFPQKTFKIAPKMVEISQSPQFPIVHSQNVFRDKVPPRPQGQRSEPTTSNPFSGFRFGGGQGGGGGGFHMSFGIGAFPFTFFASNFNFGEERPGAPGQGSHQATEEAFLHKVFLWVSPF